MDALLFLLIMLAFLSVGRTVTQKLWHLNFTSSAEAFVFSSALGSVITSVLVTGLAFIGQVSSSTCWVVLVILLTSGLSSLREWKSWEFKTVFFPLSPLKTSIQIILGVLVLLSLSLALAPAFAIDTLVYHLAVPKAFLEAGGIINLPNNIFSFYSQHMEMLYLFALALGTDHLAQLTGLEIVFLLLVALHQYYRQKGSATYALLVPAMFLSTPAFFTVAYSAYVDLQAAAYVFMAFYAWENWRSRKQTGWFYLMTVFAGTALATKLSAVIVLPMALLGVALQGETSTKKVFGKCFIFALGTLLFILPWWGRNYFFTGNPLAPFFMTFFGGEDGMNWDITRSLQHFQYFSSYGMGHGILDFLLLPINLTFFGQPHSLKFDGQIGILYLLLLPALFGLRRQSMPMVVTFLILMVFWFTQTQQARFLSTPFAFLAILSIQGLEELFSSQKSTVRKKEKNFLLAILVLALIFNTFLIAKSWAKIQPLPYIFQKESREPFLMRQIPAYPVYLSANHIVERDEKILLVYMRNLGFLMDKPFLSDSIFEAHTLKKIIDEEVYAGDIINRLKSMGITHILFNNKFVFGEYSALSPGERGILKNFLARHAQRILVKNEFFLYRFVLDLDLENPNNAPISLDHSGPRPKE
jgi:hypothetical protein